jgi:hypothetical protein
MATRDDVIGRFGVNRNAKGEKDTTGGATPASLLQRVTELENENRRLNETNFALLGQKPIEVVDPSPQTFEEPTLSLEGLPDAFTEPELHAKELSKRLNATISGTVAAREAKARHEAERQRSIEAESSDLWQGFSKKFKDLADYEDEVGFAAQKVLKDKVAKGIDPTRYMKANRDVFYDEVAAIARKYVPQEKEDGNDTGDKPDNTAAHSDDPTNGLNVYGGFVAPTKGAKAEVNTGESMLDSLKEIQRVSGWF